MVISQSHTKNTEVDITQTIKLQVSKGPEPTEPTDPPLVVMDVTIDLKGLAAEGECTVRIIHNTAEIFNSVVSQGTEAVVLEDQSAYGMQKYTVIVNDTETWDVTVEFV